MAKIKVTLRDLKKRNSLLQRDPITKLTDLEESVVQLYINGSNFTKGNKLRSLILSEYAEQFESEECMHDGCISIDAVNSHIGEKRLSSLISFVFNDHRIKNRIFELIKEGQADNVYSIEFCMNEFTDLYIQNKYDDPKFAKSCLDSMMKGLAGFDPKSVNKRNEEKEDEIHENDVTQNEIDSMNSNFMQRKKAELDQQEKARKTREVMKQVNS